MRTTNHTNDTNLIGPPHINSTPERIFILARTNHLLAAILTAWKHGHCSWEQALMTGLEQVTMHNDRLRKELKQADKMVLPPPVRIGGLLHEYRGPCPLCKQLVDPDKAKRKS